MLFLYQQELDLMIFSFFINSFLIIFSFKTLFSLEIAMINVLEYLFIKI